jgi:lambda family phage minor tail protein L
MNTLFKLDNYVILDLYEIELESNEGFFRFHGSKNFSKNLVFQNNEYLFLPCELSAFEKTSNGRQSRPSLKIANVNNYFSKILADRNDLVGKKFYRKKILAKDLDVINFTDGVNPYGISSFNTYIAFDKLIINLKKSENKQEIELELSSKIDIQNLNIPARKVTNDTCGWNYRCSGCNYGNTSNYAGPIIKNASGDAANALYFFQNVWQNSVSSTPSYPGITSNIGVPIADQNDKTFLLAYKSSLSNNSYNLPSLTYKGEWLSTRNYNKGDFIFIDPLPSMDLDEESYVTIPLNSPKIFFVCIEDNVINKNPLDNTNVWKQDKCSKTLNGCLLRFEDNKTSSGNSRTSLPFGAFPATYPYDNDVKK